VRSSRDALADGSGSEGIAIDAALGGAQYPPPWTARGAAHAGSASARTAIAEEMRIRPADSRPGAAGQSACQTDTSVSSVRGQIFREIGLCIDTGVSVEDSPQAVPASYFDVDGTLVRTNLLHPTLFYLLNQQTPLRSLGRLARAAARAPRIALAELQDRRLFNELLFSAYQGMSRDRLLFLADDAFDTVIKKALYTHAKELVTRVRENGHDVILVTGALDFLMEPLSKHLGATGFIANRLEFANGFATGRLLRPVVAGPEKARLVREHARHHGHDLDDCFAYSDSYSDVPMLSVVGHPAAVNPDFRLAQLAAAHGWPVLNLEHPS
jgi:HAD superfamily hydrolase (TIGR01490 family)